MPNIQRILAATDLSPCAAFADLRAAMIAAELRCNAIDLLHVIDPSLTGALERMLKDTPSSEGVSLEEHARRELNDVASRIKSETGMKSECRVIFGRPATQIGLRAEAISADVVVVGAHGCNSISRFFIGNTPYKLLHAGKSPLLIVKNSPERHYHNVLVPVDFSESSKRAAQLALAIAPHANVLLLNVFGVPQAGLMQYSGVSGDYINAYRIGAEQIAIGEMERFLSGLETERTVSTSVQFGYPTFVIQDYAEKFKPDLIVMGKHGQNRVEDYLLGSVTRSTIEGTSCDILVTLPS